MDSQILARIRLLVLDVDGVLTDGQFTILPSGEETKSFNSKDGSGIKFWIRAGGMVALISGRKSDVVAHRAKELGVDAVRQGCKKKAPVLREILEELDVSPDEAIVMGDDLPDLPLFHICAMSACPANAVREVRDAADYVCGADGGSGCVREVVELILRDTGKWDRIMDRYRPGAEGVEE
jgi:3-deoxy-D-manno-octulosonate 8-phosphate phosphatase (KDO 8-P phosphatase)